MNEKGPWTLGLMAIVIAALVARGVLPQGATGAGSPAPAPEEGRNKEESASNQAGEAWTELCPAPCLLEEFLGLPVSPTDASWPQTAGGIAEGAALQGYELEFLVALVPDPVDSHLSNLFDEALDALQRGIADSGYLFDRVSLPWQGEAAAKRLYRRMPGGLLFRKADEKGRRLLVVLLVGESPKGGIQKQAFYTALEFIASLQPEPERKLRILGPSFSGSAESLRIALQKRFAGSPRAVRMVTGSATARDLEAFFRDQIDGVVVEVERTLVDDVVLQERAFELLHERLGWDLGQIALITEFDTAYGQRSGGFQGSGSRRRSPRIVQFPSNLAHIRTAREKLGLDRKGGASDDRIAARRSLDLSLADQEKPVDVVPQLNELSTQVNDLALASLLRGIARSRYIGILATDIQDRLFLAEQVHSFCPDAVVFTFDNHLLDAHPKVSKSMDGTLILTSFPLYSSRENRTSRQFTSELQQGIYLAALHLIRNPPRLAPPNVWVAAVGNGSLWPIAAISPRGSPPGLRVPPIRGTDRTGFKWLLAALGIAALAAWLLRLARPLQNEIAGWRRTVLPAIGAGALWLGSAALLVFYAIPLMDTGQPPRWQRELWCANLVLLALIYLGTAFVFVRLVRPPRRWTEALLWTVAAVLVPVLFCRAMSRLWLFPEGAAFFAARAGDFSSGLSPLVSLAFLGAAVYTWAVIELKRCRLNAVHGLPWPLPASPDPALADCGRRANELRRVLEGSPGKAFWIVLGVVLLVPALRLFERIQPIAETWGYGVFFVLAVMLVFLLSAVSFYRFFVAWRRLERILGRLCSSWMLPVFSAASRLLDWKPMKSFGLRMPPIKMTLVSAQQLRTLARLDLLGPDGVALGGGAGGPRGALDDHLDRLFEAEERGEIRHEIAERNRLETWFDRSAAHLEWVRWTSGSADPVPDDANGKPVPRPREVEMREIETYLAARVVAYLRYVFAHLRYALVSSTICGLALLFAVSSYAFQPKRFLSFGIWMALLLASAMTLRAFVQMDRNGALSAISGTDAGKVSLDRTFFSNLLTYGGVPVIGVVLTQFPSVGHLFGGWLGPLLRVVGGGD